MEAFFLQRYIFFCRSYFRFFFDLSGNSEGGVRLGMSFHVEWSMNYGEIRSGGRLIVDLWTLSLGYLLQPQGIASHQLAVGWAACGPLQTSFRLGPMIQSGRPISPLPFARFASRLTFCLFVMP